MGKYTAQEAQDILRQCVPLLNSVADLLQKASEALSEAVQDHQEYDVIFHPETDNITTLDDYRDRE